MQQEHWKIGFSANPSRVQVRHTGLPEADDAIEPRLVGEVWRLSSRLYQLYTVGDEREMFTSGSIRDRRFSDSVLVDGALSVGDNN